MRRAFAICALTACCVSALVGCQSSGAKTDQATIQQLYAHRATYYDVVAQLGPPTQETVSSDGTRQVVYSYRQIQGNWQSFVPFADRWAGGSTSEHSDAVLFFDTAGALTSFTWSGGKDKSGYGLESGKKQ